MVYSPKITKQVFEKKIKSRIMERVFIFRLKQNGWSGFIEPRWESGECGESVLFMSKFREEKKEANGEEASLISLTWR